MPQTDDDQGSLMFRCCFHDLFGRLGATQWLVNLVVHSGVVELATGPCHLAMADIYAEIEFS